METETHYQYDGLNRLVAVTYPDGRKVEYTYDPAGNRLSVQVSGTAVEAPGKVEVPKPVAVPPATVGAELPETPTLKPVTGARVAGYRLVSLAGEAQADIELLAEMSIGRQKNNDIRIEDELVSRRHAVIRAAGSACHLTDLGSSNGTFVNGKKIEGTVPVKANDVLRIGGSEFRLEAVLEAVPFDEAKTVLVPQPPAVKADVPPIRAAVDQPEPPAAGKTPAALCPHCNQPVDPQAKFCGNCGQSLLPKEEAPPMPKFCPSCGAEILPGKRFCRRCGHPLG